MQGHFFSEFDIFEESLECFFLVSLIPSKTSLFSYNVQEKR